MRAPNSLVRVAIVDTGIEPSHPDIGKIAGGVGIYIHEGRHPVFSDNFVDSYGHGTACAGIIRKKAPDAEIFSVRHCCPRTVRFTGMRLRKRLQ